MSFVIWLLGPSGAGKTTLGKGLKAQMSLRPRSWNIILLDGDEVRNGLSRDLGLDENARTENIRRVAEVARLLAMQGQGVICALMTPQRSQQKLVTEILGQIPHLLVHVACEPLELLRRDTKGLYAKANLGTLKQPLYGFNSEFEESDEIHLKIDTSQLSVKESLSVLEAKVAEQVLGFESPSLEASTIPLVDIQI